jgi:8-oxo-(d)GTP phosphatase
VAQIRAAGAVLWRPSGEIALVHRPRYDDWSLPKGKLESGESVWHAAARELLEETGFMPTLGRRLGRIRYLFRGIPKVVDYFSAIAGPGRFQPNKEVDELRWVPVDEAQHLLSHQGDHEILQEFQTIPPDAPTLALVRHAVAGDRSSWHGKDDLRPLNSQGRNQAAALRALLPLFGVNHVHSAPLARCVQTVSDLADDLGTPVVDEPTLSERGYAPAAAVSRIRELAAAGRSVVCSQGGVIPDLLSRLAKDSPLTLNDPRSAKGSAWILTFNPTGHLAAADYIQKPTRMGEK